MSADDDDQVLEAAQDELEQRRKSLLKGPRADIPPMGPALRAVVADRLNPEKVREKRERWITRNLEPAAIEGVLRDYGVGERLRTLEIDDELIPTECWAFIETASDGGNLILAGPPGSGKTTGAVWCLRKLYGLRVSQGVGAPRARYMKVADLYRMVFEGDRAGMVQVERADVLVLDDWGAAYEHRWPLSALDNMIDRRWESLLPTIVTTNLHPERGENSIKTVLPRAFDRLTGHPGPGVALLDRESMRQRGKS